MSRRGERFRSYASFTAAGTPQIVQIYSLALPAIRVAGVSNAKHLRNVTLRRLSAGTVLWWCQRRRRVVIQSMLFPSSEVYCFEIVLREREAYPQQSSEKCVSCFCWIHRMQGNTQYAVKRSSRGCCLLRCPIHTIVTLRLPRICSQSVCRC